MIWKASERQDSFLWKLCIKEFIDFPLFYFYQGYSLYSSCCRYSIAASRWIQLMMTCKCYALSFFLCLKPYFRILYCHPLLQFLGVFCIKSMPVAKTLEKGTEPLISLCGWGKNLYQRHGFVSLAGRRAGGGAARVRLWVPLLHPSESACWSCQIPPALTSALGDGVGSSWKQRKNSHPWLCMFLYMSTACWNIQKPTCFNCSMPPLHM